MSQEKNKVLFEKTFQMEGGDFIRAGEVSSQVKKLLREIGIDNDTIRRLSIAVFEAEINVVSYAERGKLHLKIKEDKLEVIIEDIGRGIEDINMAMQEGYSTATDEIREMGFGAGMGLPNIKKNADVFHIESTVGQGTRLKIIINTKALGSKP